MESSIINKKNIINFFRFIEEKKTLQGELVEKTLLNFYDLKTKIMFIDEKSLSELIKKFSIQKIAKTLAILFRTKKIEFPFVSISIPLDVIKHTLNNIFENDIIEKLRSESTSKIKISHSTDYISPGTFTELARVVSADIDCKKLGVNKSRVGLGSGTKIDKVQNLLSCCPKI